MSVAGTNLTGGYSTLGTHWNGGYSAAGTHLTGGNSAPGTLWSGSGYSAAGTNLTGGYSTAGTHRSVGNSAPGTLWSGGYSAAGNSVPVSGYNWTSQTSSGREPDAARRGVAEAVTGPTARGLMTELEHLVRQGGVASRGESKLAAVAGTEPGDCNEDEDDETGDENSALSLSVNRFVYCSLSHQSTSPGASIPIY